MYVRNRASPEGSIAEGYLANECLTFASRYLVGTETSFNQSTRNEEDQNVANDEEVSFFANVGRPLGRKKNKGFSSNKRKRVSRITLDNQTLVQAHRYGFFNFDGVAPFLKKHEQFIKRRNRSPRLSPYEIQKLQSETFHDWFHDHVAQLEQQGNANITDELRLLARGPMDTTRRYTGYIVNGFRFHTKARERWLKTQNSGVVVTSKMMSYASSRDARPIEGEINYYGVLTDIIQLNYSGRFKVVLFKCDWIDPNRGLKKDKFGFTIVNFSHLAHSGTNLVDDPFVFASQAKKVFYVQDEKNKDWLIVKHAKLRDIYDIGGGSSFNRGQGSGEVQDDDSHDTTKWVRNEVDGVELTQEMKTAHEEEQALYEHNEDLF
ncbi:uncharacterized protein LOC120277730 [Dioscorea cayenensis subsp. rotundata]|uniref:Uncharacterized protein LOC120277730 n=1 Tax=Dioscorea cayennensis subsp. rotundata TaxID=55577 RepID=A0AB40CMD2_DIOCR|nr:uncharacterized protein LOC120277730 [Dioscorea cayenensis subsp. rotundata]